MANFTRIFLTGASGYIGGDILHALRQTHPEYKIRVLVRDDVKAAAISKAYSDVQIVKGDLDAENLIEEEVSQTDVIVHAASSSHIKSVEAIARGLARCSSSTPAHWIQVSGASVLSISDIVAGRYGEGAEKVFSDVDGADEVRDIIHQYSNKRVVDDFILNLTGARTALVFPPIIYGQGRGVIKRRSVQIPELSRVTIETKQGVQVGKGENTWSNVHISDVSDIFVKLVETAVKGETEGLWNMDGLYFPGTGSLSFGKISQKVAEAAKGLELIDSIAIKELNHDEADKLSPHGAVLWGTNAQQDSQRARKLLGWEPKGKSLDEEIPETVRIEAMRLEKL
ncbi:NAD(P)-binding protein [Aspergillus californicus]